MLESYASKTRDKAIFERRRAALEAANRRDGKDAKSQNHRSHGSDGRLA